MFLPSCGPGPQTAFYRTIVPFFHRIATDERKVTEKEGKERKRFDNNLYCDTDEEATFRELMATGLECICQTTPEEIAIPLKKLIQ